METKNLDILVQLCDLENLLKWVIVTLWCVYSLCSKRLEWEVNADLDFSILWKSVYILPLKSAPLAINSFKGVSS
jgi:hypothetical protein